MDCSIVASVRRILTSECSCPAPHEGTGQERQFSQGMRMTMRATLTKIWSIFSSGRGIHRLFSGTVVLVMTGCATTSFNPSTTERWLPDGSLSIVRPLPSLSLVSEAMASPKQEIFTDPKARMRAPIEPPSNDLVPKLTIDTTKHTITLTTPGESPVTMKAQGAYSLKKGSYSVALKQTDPLWYAPPTYFLRRGLKVPADGSKARFMGGALGHQALFFDKQLAIHSGPVWNDEIGGVKLSRDDMNKVFETVSVGTKIEVR